MLYSACWAMSFSVPLRVRRIFNLVITTDSGKINIYILVYFSLLLCYVFFLIYLRRWSSEFFLNNQKWPLSYKGWQPLTYTYLITVNIVIYFQPDCSTPFFVVAITKQPSTMKTIFGCSLFGWYDEALLFGNISN